MRVIFCISPDEMRASTWSQTIALPNLLGPEITAWSGTKIHSPLIKTRYLFPLMSHSPLVERVAVSLGTAIPAKIVLQRLKPRLQWTARPLAGWIADQDNGSSE